MIFHLRNHFHRSLTKFPWDKFSYFHDHSSMENIPSKVVFLNSLCLRNFKNSKEMWANLFLYGGK